MTQVDENLTVDGDRQGFARIVSALHAHTWSGLRMHKRLTSKPRATAEPAGGTDAAAPAVQVADGAAGSYQPPSAPLAASSPVESACDEQQPSASAQVCCLLEPRRGELPAVCSIPDAMTSYF